MCPGNHESKYDFAGFRHRFDMPVVAPLATGTGTGTGSGPGTSTAQPGANNLWHSYEYGGVYFVAMSTEHDYEVGSEQLKFLDAALARAAAAVEAGDADWIVMYG